MEYREAGAPVRLASDVSFALTNSAVSVVKFKVSEGPKRPSGISSMFNFYSFLALVLFFMIANFLVAIHNFRPQS